MSMMSRLLAMRANRGDTEPSAVDRNIHVSKTGTAHRPGCRYWRADNLHTEAEVNADLGNLNWGNCCHEGA